MRILTTLGIAAALALAGSARATGFSGWSTAQTIDEIDGNSTELNTPSLDGCPIQSADALSLYVASNRPGGQGGLDILGRHAPKHERALGTAAGPSGPDQLGRRRLLPHKNHGWSEPKHFACAPAGPNTVLDEQGPSFLEIEGTEYLYFSSSRGLAQGGFVPGEIFVSERAGDGFGPAAAVGALKDATANDIQPNIRKDGRELVFSSDRGGGLGGQDIWVSMRGSASDAWSTPVNLGSAVNTAAAESRPSLSRHAEQFLFGRAPGPEGQSDIYVSMRDNLERSEN